MTTRPFRHLLTLIAALAAATTPLTACAPPALPALSPSRLPFRADSLRTIVVAPGLVHHFVYSSEGPWAVQVLEVHRNACWSLRAAKGVDGAIGRRTTSGILAGLKASGESVYAGVNADFFSLATGVPQSLLIERGRMLAGPSERPALLIDSAGGLTIGTLSVSGGVSTGQQPPLRLSGWNRIVKDGLAVLDPTWGAESDTGSARIEIGLRGPAPYTVAFVDTLAAASAVPAGGFLLVAGASAPSTLRAAMLALRAGDTVQVSRALVPSLPSEAVGGWPVILRDGIITGAADSSGATFAPVRHPRTAIGLADSGQTVWIVVVDGRQKPWSDGMTLRELAHLFQSLGATQALNLDGGGSTTFITADRDDSRALHVRNRPSDKGGERTVGDALAVVKRC